MKTTTMDDKTKQLLANIAFDSGWEDLDESDKVYLNEKVSSSKTVKNAFH